MSDCPGSVWFGSGIGGGPELLVGPILSTAPVSCSTICDAIIPAVKSWETVVIAYEPVWAIGTGKVATVKKNQSYYGSKNLNPS